MLSLTFDESVPEAARAGWRQSLVEALETYEIRLEEEGKPGAVPVSLAVELLSGAGSTPSGTRFFAARARAELRLFRVRLQVEGPAVVGEDLQEAQSEALERLVEAVLEHVAW